MTKGEVLILVLMEDTLREVDHDDRRCLYLVLILVLMEDTLRVDRMTAVLSKVNGLNPCFNGRYSQSLTHVSRLRIEEVVLILVLMEDTLRELLLLLILIINCLNPCFNGRYSQSVIFISLFSIVAVLILVLMEDTLRE